jgi:hypothetical protein
MTAVLKLHQFSKRKPCYYCGAIPPSTPEHAPPQMMFDGFECDSITVPSCEKHNHSKSTSDRAIITAIIMSAYQEWKRDPTCQILTPNVIKAIKVLEPNFSQAKNEVSLKKILVNPPSNLDIPFPYTQPSVNPRDWIRQLTAALVWSVIGKHDARIEWDKSRVWSPGLFPIIEPIDSEKAAELFIKHRDIEGELNALDWHSGWSPKPRNYPMDIYSFDICFLESPQKWEGIDIMFRHRFYNNTSVWFLGITVPAEIKSLLRSAVDNT